MKRMVRLTAFGISVVAGAAFGAGPSSASPGDRTIDPNCCWPNSSGDILPKSTGDVIPKSTGDIIPKVEDVIPEKPQDVVPPAVQNVLPKVEDVVPEKPQDVLPPAVQDIVPDTSTIGLPQKPEDIVPQKPADILGSGPGAVFIPQKPQDILPGKPEDLLPEDRRHIPISPWVDDRFTDFGESAQPILTGREQFYQDSDHDRVLPGKYDDLVRVRSVGVSNPRSQGRCMHSGDSYVKIHYNNGSRPGKYLLKVYLKPFRMPEGYFSWDQFSRATTIFETDWLYAPRNPVHEGYMKLDDLAGGSVGIVIMDRATRRTLHRQFSGLVPVRCGLDQDIYLSDMPQRAAHPTAQPPVW